MVSPPSETPSSGVEYAYRASAIGSAHRFALEDDGISWRVSRRTGRWGYADIAAVRMSYRPMSMQSRRFRTEISHRDGGRIIVMSTTWRTLALMDAQDNDYRTFIVELHRRLAEHGARATLVGGLNPLLYFAGAGVLMLLLVAMTALLARAIVTGEWAGALFIVGLSAFFGWQIGRFMRRNRPRAYTFDALPQDLLP
ncbi:hypothetical protein NB311A_11647 [Nitrobacter sp. Nb-311A]|uniref:hypothetical protein n=1 Tax=unclassified Nitrobacter TaxID=2620411 RepID=UPI00006865DA|nr:MULTISPECIES: hypothetical protein [unclassified Nitrobacter]EAQ36093.1 hypothetical protein NB311A_11647 [Nitrobacter sp. Nb-311A]MCB1392031.1 hypothetical protein [Nitrobacter sp.]MCV0385756.1 hypothetical protein [Nitrobacter sp.]